jgi:RHS repeat-associated protein
LSYTYNTDFNISSFRYAGKTQIYTYDTDGLLTGAGKFVLSRHNNPGVNETGLPHNITDTVFNLDRTFNGYGETDGENTDVNGTDIYTWSVTDRYPDGRIHARTDTIGGVTTTYGYTYDKMGRLATVTKDGALVEEYRYDNAPYGTCTYQMNTQRGITGRILSYDAENRLLSTGDAQYQYDPDGFLESKTTTQGTTTYDYASQGDLLSVTLPDGTFIEYLYDPLGRRIAKKVDGAFAKKYLWHGLTRLLAVYDGSDNLLMRFKYAGGRLPVATEKDGSFYYLAFDQVGSLRAVADATGSMIKKIDYDAFGSILADTNPDFEVPFGFAGGLHDRDTGLVRFGYRDYDPDTGRWTSKDPILFAGGDTDLYGYVLNNPISFIDPFGWKVSDILPGIRTAIIEGVKGGTYAVGEAGKFVGRSIKPSKQTLNVTTNGATVLVVASAFYGNIPTTIIFTIIGGSANALKSTLYSDTPCNDAISQGIQSAVQAPPVIDPIVDKVIENSINFYIETKNLPKM